MIDAVTENTTHLHNVSQCWASVVDGGPTLVKHGVDGSCLLGIYVTANLPCKIKRQQRTRRDWLDFNVVGRFDP